MQDGTAEGTRVRIDRSHEHGVVALAGAVALTGLEILDTLERHCAETSCAGLGAGNGAVSVDGSGLRIERFTIARAALCGVFLDGTSTIDLVDGEIRESTIGACVQNATYDLGRLSTDVAYADNGTPIDSTSIPIPEPQADLEEL